MTAEGRGSAAAAAGAAAPAAGAARADPDTLHREILKTVSLPHYFGSAFDREQARRYLRIRIDDESFAAALRRLEAAGELTEVGGALHTRVLDGSLEQRRDCSRELFSRHRRYLHALSRLPWVRYVGLTGANAFESCRSGDDIDLFMVTQRDRLWLAFAAVIAFGRCVGRRDLFCVNYVVDEDHLRLGREDYYTAVQLMSMVTLVDRGIGARLVEENRWVFRHLPNAAAHLRTVPFYALEAPRGAASRALGGGLASGVNRWLLGVYAHRLRRKYPEAFGKGIVVAEGLAKLHRVDYADVYEKVGGS
jgi:hypothetical protein